MSKVREEKEEEDLVEKRYEEILDLLLAAGYFRVRIQSLSRFDKIIGGLAWCVTSLSVDVSSEVAFHEDSNIKEKIKMSGDIVRALVNLKCPVQLQPHQIQGLDTVKLFPGFQWLVKRVMETREEEGDVTRSFAVFKSNQDYTLPLDVTAIATKNRLEVNLERLASFSPKRVYINTTPPRSVSSRVESCMREFGYMTQAVLTLQNQRSQTLEIKLGGQPQTKPKQQQDPEMLKSSQSDSISASKISQILGIERSKIEFLAGKHKLLEEGLESFDPNRQSHLEKLHEIRVRELQREILARNTAIKELKSEGRLLESQIGEGEEAIRKKGARKQLVISETEKLAVSELSNDKFESLRALVLLNESLKEQEASFKKSCRAQLKKFGELREGLELEAQTLLSSEKEEMISKAYDQESKKFAELRMVLGERLREIGVLKHRIDSVPSREELIQFERRFVELYEQVNMKLKETKRSFTQYNVLNKSLSVKQNQLEFLNAMVSRYKKAIRSQESHDKFVSQFGELKTQATGNLMGISTQSKIEREKFEETKKTLKTLREKQTRYFALVHRFQEECTRRKPEN